MKKAIKENKDQLWELNAKLRLGSLFSARGNLVSAKVLLDFDTHTEEYDLFDLKITLENNLNAEYKNEC